MIAQALPSALRPAPSGPKALWGAGLAIFWPGVLAFGLPGVLASHWQTSLGVGRGAVGGVMLVLLAGVGSFMYLAGRWQLAWGLRRVMLLGGLGCGLDALVLAWAPSIEVVYVWAFIMGASQSLVVITALTTVQTWFPHRRGLVTGVVSLVFGGAPGLLSPLLAWLLGAVGYTGLNLLVGGATLAMALIGTGLCARPASARAPAPPAGTGGDTSLRPGQALATRAFWLLWVTLGLMGAGGVAMVTLSTTYGLSLGLSLSRAVIILTTFNLMSGLSRLVMGYASDRVGRTPLMGASFAAAGAAYLLLPWLGGLGPAAVAAGVVGWAFGALFSLSPPLISDCFGPRHFGELFGLAFTSYGFGSGAVGPALAGWLLDVTSGGYTLVFSYLGVMCLVAGGLVLGVRAPALARVAR